MIHPIAAGKKSSLGNSRSGTTPIDNRPGPEGGEAPTAWNGGSVAAAIQVHSYSSSLILHCKTALVKVVGGTLPGEGLGPIRSRGVPFRTFFLPKGKGHSKQLTATLRARPQRLGLDRPSAAGTLPPSHLQRRIHCSFCPPALLCRSQRILSPSTFIFIWVSVELAAARKHRTCPPPPSSHRPEAS
jgi:hypothetical protein